MTNDNRIADKTALLKISPIVAAFPPSFPTVEKKESSFLIRQVDRPLPMPNPHPKRKFHFTFIFVSPSLLL